MYSIVLTDGKIINIKADEVEWCEKARMTKLFNNKRIVARINMDNVVGWIDTDYKTESEEKNYSIKTVTNAEEAEEYQVKPKGE